VSDYSKAWADAFSDASITDTVYHDAGDTVVAEFVGRGTNDGPLGPLPATGRTVALPYCEIYHFDADGKVAGGRAYFDQLGLLVQLGLAEAPPG
jgi:ketosteroid isomerase-like protein